MKHREPTVQDKLQVMKVIEVLIPSLDLMIDTLGLDVVANALLHMVTNLAVNTGVTKEELCEAIALSYDDIVFAKKDGEDHES